MKNDNFEKYVRPNTAYITFKYEDTFVAAITKMKSIKFCGETMNLKRAKEPTNIIWENRDISKNARRCRGAIVISIMATILIGFFLFATWALQTKLVAKYYAKPPGVDCENVISNYGTEGDDVGNKALQTMAWHEVQEIERLDKEWDEAGKLWYLQLNQRASLQGSATCFCLNEIKNKKVSKDEFYDVETENGIESV